MHNKLSRQDVIDLLRAEALKLGSQRKLAKAMHVSPSLVSLIINGVKPPEHAVLDYLGLVKQTEVWYVWADDGRRKPHD